MEQELTFGSVCSGIESASVAWEPLGMNAAWFAEVEKFPSAVLAHHWPDVPNVGDMTNIPSMVRMEMLAAPAVLIGGTPCQAFSVAGRRGGLADERGQLTLTYVGILNAIDEQRGAGNEAVCVWENVPGVLSSKDNAFGCFLGALAGEDCELNPSGKRWPNAGCVFGPQRVVAWRILDAQYFGVAQRRRRVFVVASARAGFDPRKVLFESEGVRWGTPPSRPTGQETAAFTETSFGGWGPGVGTLRATGAALGGGSEALLLSASSFGRTDFWDCTSALCASDYKGVSNQLIDDGKVVFSSSAERPPRRLTVTECERLQGFPDGHTCVPYRNGDAPDGPRYKAIGNSKAVPVVRWLGFRLLWELLQCN